MEMASRAFAVLKTSYPEEMAEQRWPRGLALTTLNMSSEVPGSIPATCKLLLYVTRAQHNTNIINSITSLYTTYLL